MALTEKPAADTTVTTRTAAEQKAADEAAAKRRAEDTRTPDERVADRAAAAARQLELQQLVARRADALERDDEQDLHDVDVALRGHVTDTK